MVPLLSNRSLLITQEASAGYLLKLCKTLYCWAREKLLAMNRTKESSKLFALIFIFSTSKQRVCSLFKSWRTVQSLFDPRQPAESDCWPESTKEGSKSKHTSASRCCHSFGIRWSRDCFWN